MPYKYIIVVLGDLAVGKTALITQFIEKKFINNFPATIGLDFYHKEVKLDEINVKVDLSICEFPPQESYKELIKYHFGGAQGALIVYDVTRTESLESVKRIYIKGFKEYIKEGVNILVGNKIDLKDQRSVNREEGLSMAKERNASDFFEIYAKTGTNVDQCFEKLASLLLKNDQTPTHV